jgi:hypothetical protein
MPRVIEEIKAAIVICRVVEAEEAEAAICRKRILECETDIGFAFGSAA